MLFATTNEGKLLEAARVAAAYGVTLFGIDQVIREQGSPAPVVAEVGSSYEANATLKARSYAAWSGSPTIADDTGLEVEELGGLPGLFTARFGVSRVQQLLGLVRPYDARFVCCVAYAEPQGRIVAVTKEVSGKLLITHNAQGPLPYSEMFTPDGEGRTLSALVSSTSFHSHRGKAIAALLKAIGQQCVSPAL